MVVVIALWFRSLVHAENVGSSRVEAVEVVKILRKARKGMFKGRSSSNVDVRDTLDGDQILPTVRPGA